MIGRVYKIVANLVLILFILVGLFVAFSFLPIPGNYEIFTVQSGSMEPTIKTGSLIFVKSSREYSVGDVITIKTEEPKVTVTHRVIEKIEEDGVVQFKTKGDANSAEDAEMVSVDNVIGKVIFDISYLGYPVSYAKTPQGIMVLIVIPAVIIIYDELNKIKREVKKKMNCQRKKKEEISKGMNEGEETKHDDKISEKEK